MKEKEDATADDLLLLKPEKVGRMFGLATPTVYQKIACGEIPAVRLGPRVLRVPADGLRKWLASRQGK